MKPAKFLFILDAFETLNLETETSLLLMEELKARGHTVYWSELPDLELRHDRLYVTPAEVTSLAPFNKKPVESLCVDDMDAVLVRPDPPFESLYLHLTYLLDFVSPNVTQFNPGAALRNFNEKLTTLLFADFAPETLTTMNLKALEAFLERHGEIVVKPLDECSGRGVTRISKGNKYAGSDLSCILKSSDGSPRFVTAQKFLPEIAAGDKRVYLAGGEPIGIVNRVPAEGEWLGNIHQGASCAADELTEHELAVISELKPFLDINGIFLAGLDFIGGYLTEINITSPSAIRQINAVTGGDTHKKIVDLMLERLGELSGSIDSRPLAANLG